MEEYEQNNPKKLVKIRIEKQFLGAKNIGGGSLDNYTKFIFIPAVHDTLEIVTDRNGPIQELVNMIIKKSSKQQDEIEKITKKYTEDIAKIFVADDYSDLEDISSKITEKLSLYAPGSKISLQWGENYPPKTSFSDPLVSITEDNFSGPVENKGHGLQRMLTLTLLQHLSGLTNTPDVEDLIIAIEEPEIYQHPSKSRYLSMMFQKLVEEVENNTNQIFLTTHSPYFISLDKFDRIRLIQKHDNESIITSLNLTIYGLHMENNLIYIGE